MTTLAVRHESVARLVAATRDVLEARPLDGAPQDALVQRGWAPFLADLTDEALDAIETRGLQAKWTADTPSSLRLLLDEAASAIAMPSLDDGDTPVRLAHSGESPRKARHIEAFARVIGPLSEGATRVVDFGA